MKTALPAIYALIGAIWVVIVLTVLIPGVAWSLSLGLPMAIIGAVVFLGILSYLKHRDDGRGTRSFGAYLVAYAGKASVASIAFHGMLLAMSATLLIVGETLSGQGELSHPNGRFLLIHSGSVTEINARMYSVVSAAGSVWTAAAVGSMALIVTAVLIQGDHMVGADLGNSRILDPTDPLRRSPGR